MVASVLVLLVAGVRARSFATDRQRRAQEIEAREVDVYRQLTNSEAVRESQRRIYIERVRKLEARIQEKEREIVALRARMVTMTSSPDGAWPSAAVADEVNVAREAAKK
jgi:hypothetical protein